MTDNGDAIDRAIGAAGSVQQVTMRTIKGSLPSGRPFALRFPDDLQIVEAYYLVHVLTHHGEPAPEQARNRIVIPTPVLRRQ